MIILTTKVIESFIFAAYTIPVLKRLPPKNGSVRKANYLQFSLLYTEHFMMFVHLGR